VQPAVSAGQGGHLIREKAEAAAQQLEHQRGLAVGRVGQQDYALAPARSGHRAGVHQKMAAHPADQAVQDMLAGKALIGFPWIESDRLAVHGQRCLAARLEVSQIAGRARVAAQGF